MPRKRKTPGVSSDDTREKTKPSCAPPVNDSEASPLDTSFGALNRPNARWRELQIQINFEPILDAESVATVQRIAFKDFRERHKEAIVLEEKRVRERLKQIRLGEGGKQPSRRPLDKALSLLEQEGSVVHQRHIFGHVPGIDIGAVFDCKAQMKAVGLHRVVMAGIDFAKKDYLHKDSPSLAVAIAISGCYEDDADDDHEITYTGQGGNDLMGDRRQTGDQKLGSANLALYNNAVYGVPVRVIKRNKGKLIYDGLWDVHQMIRKRGIGGFYVLQYRLTRCPGQKPSQARPVEFNGSNCRGPLEPAALHTLDEICPDFSRGMNGQLVSVANSVDTELPPGLTLEDLPEHILQQKAWTVSPEPFQFGLEMRFGPGVPEMADPSDVPELFQNVPHDYLVTLNHGCLPYTKHGTLHHAMCILYECGPWLHCRNGANCRQAVTSKPSNWRFQVRCPLDDEISCMGEQIFKTENRGWGLKSLDLIPVGSFVMKYIGEMLCAENVSTEGQDLFSFNMTKRPDYSDDNRWLSVPEVVDPRYVVTGRYYGNLFRFINHSCDPNCFIQPVLSHHMDRSRPDINIFAMRQILPGEEISYDYGRDYVEKLLENGCKCGAACCVKRAVEAVEA